MKKLSQYNVRTRMTAVFAVIFLLSLLTTLGTLLRFKEVSENIDNLMVKTMVKYQSANGWYGNSNAAITRTTVISKSSDTIMLAKYFEAEAKRTTASSTEFQNTFEKLITTSEEKELFDKIAGVRKNYLQSRSEVQKLKDQGKSDEAEQLYNSAYLPAAKGYAEALFDLVSLEAKYIAQTGKTVQDNYVSSKNTIIVLTFVTLVIAIILAVLVSKSILNELGGEPKYAAEVAKIIAAGNLSVRIDTKTSDKNSLLYNLEQMRISLSDIVQEVRTSANSISTASSEIAAGNQDLSSRTEQQASTLEETASSMEELSSTVKQNADNAMSAQQLVNGTVKLANEGGQVVNEVVSMMGNIKDSSQKIVDIISVIDGIAFQTNILALNAAVEAARAGDQGRGFAVVASEVRNLAQRSASAAKEIKGLISDSVEKVEKGVELVNKAGMTINNVVDNVNSVSSIMSEISEASREQSLGINEVAKAVGQMDNVTQQNAALVEEAAAAAHMLQEQTNSLEHIVNKFTV